MAENAGPDQSCVRRSGSPGEASPLVPSKARRFFRYAAAAGVLALSTVAAWAFDVFGLSETNVVLVYLLGVAMVAAWFGRGPSVFASFGAVLLFNFFFTLPYYTLHVYDSSYLFTFAVMLAIGLLVGTLTSRIRAQSTEVHRTFLQAENERLRSAVLSSVSHDFRTPLSTITGASSSLLDGGDRIAPDEQRCLIQSIYEEADRLSRLVDNLLHMTRLESGQIEPKREWHIVEDIVGSALTRLARRLATHEVATRIPGHGMPMIRVDGVLIELVLANLLDNAAKYSPAGSSIEISARVEGGRVLVKVADHGPGLSAQEKERAFEKFYRGPMRCEDGSRGAGLGLSIAAAVVRLHGGSLGVEDREGGGARFTLALPLEEQPPALLEESTPDDTGGEKP